MTVRELALFLAVLPVAIGLWAYVGYPLALWLLTAILGTRGADKAFDRDFARGTMGRWDSPIQVDVIRIPFQRLLRPEGDLPERPWRMRSRGIAIAPFLIVDEAAWYTHSLAGFAGWRLVIWFFGWTTWLPLKAYWVS